MKSLFDLSTIYLTCVLCYVVSGCVANSVDTIKELLSSPIWLEMDKPDDPLRIVDPRQADQTELTVNELLATEVTDGNVADQIRLVHQFLSCSYASILIDLCVYEQGIGPQCKSKNTASESFDCLEDYLQIIKHKNPAVSRMIGALSALYDLSPSQTEIQNEVHSVLVELQLYYQQKTVVRPPRDDDQATREIANTESDAVEQHANKMANLLNVFHYNHCRPVSDDQKDKVCSKATYEVTKFVEHGCSTQYSVVHKIKEELKKIIKEFTERYDHISGFEYDPEFSTTRIITYDPNTAERVAQLNQHFELGVNKTKWIGFNPLEIKDRGSPYMTNIYDLLKPAGGPDDTVVVTKHNIYAKLKKAHRFLSCKYAWILKYCCDTVATMWANCEEPKDSAFLAEFLAILNQSDNYVLRMVDALKYFYGLSPDTVHNKDIFNLLERFRSVYNDRNYTSWPPEIEKAFEEIEKGSSEFYQQFCYSVNELTTAYVERPLDATLKEKGDKFLLRISLLTHFNAQFK